MTYPVDKVICSLNNWGQVYKLVVAFNGVDNSSSDIASVESWDFVGHGQACFKNQLSLPLLNVGTVSLLWERNTVSCCLA